MDVALGGTGLPVEEVVGEVRAALAAATHAVLQAPPGAGKTTVVPLRLLDAAWLGDQRIVMLEPRRLAARAAAARMASMLGEAVGATVGVTTRDERKVGPSTRVEVVTEGILTRRLQRDPALEGVGLVILDEFHERNLQADLALALLLDARPVLRPDLRVLVMSATIATDRVAALVGGEAGPAPVVTSDGRLHPVEVRWDPPPPRQRVDQSMAAAVARALDRHEGDVLAFLPGAADIRRTEERLTTPGTLPAGVEVRTLFGALTGADQDAALSPAAPGTRRVVLATDIAETSLTVEGVRVVVDAGLARRPEADGRTGLTRLHTVPAARSSADQRSGRAGRTAPGVAYRLWSKLEHAARPAFPAPEIATVDLAPLALELAVWGTPPERLALLDQPPAGALAQARTVLTDLGAIDADGHPTDAGRAMADLPVHPRLAHMIIEGRNRGLGWEACVLAAVLEERDALRGRPDELPTDASIRLALVGGDDRSSTSAVAGGAPVDRRALATARRRAGQLARRARVERHRPDLDATGLVLALAYPDRIAQQRGRSRVRLRSGTGAWLPDGDPLATEALLVVAELDAGKGDARVRLAAALDVADVEAAAGASVERVVTVAWDPARDDLRQRAELRLDALVLGGTEGPASPGEATTAALLDRVRSTRLGVLRWPPGTARLRQRVAFARRATGDQAWPELSDEALLATLDEWLAPLLPGATGRADLERLDMARVVRDMVGHHRLHDLDRIAPDRITLAGGRSAEVAYDADEGRPTIAVRAQDAYGTTIHPTVADGRVPVVVELLSPAGRPIQVTADLPGFWAGSWTEVRKDMAGRYPKHDWPTDPATAVARARPPRPRR